VASILTGGALFGQKVDDFF